jgi:hypothetical protein
LGIIIINVFPKKRRNVLVMEEGEVNAGSALLERLSR